MTDRELETQPAEYVSEQLDLSAPSIAAFSDVFARFQLPADEPIVRPAPTIYA